jgi:hypothetical protein
LNARPERDEDVARAQVVDQGRQARGAQRLVLVQRQNRQDELTLEQRLLLDDLHDEVLDQHAVLWDARVRLRVLDEVRDEQMLEQRKMAQAHRRARDDALLQKDADRLRKLRVVADPRRGLELLPRRDIRRDRPDDAQTVLPERVAGDEEAQLGKDLLVVPAPAGGGLLHQAGWLLRIFQMKPKSLFRPT